MRPRNFGLVVVGRSGQATVSTVAELEREACAFARQRGGVCVGFWVGAVDTVPGVRLHVMVRDRAGMVESCTVAL